MGVSVAVMSSLGRQRAADELLKQLDCNAPVISSPNRWERGRGALLAHDPRATHHLVIDSEAVPCRDLLAGLERAAAAAGERPIGLYLGRRWGRFSERDPRLTAVLQAMKLRRTWLAMLGVCWEGVALAFPTAHIHQLVEWGDRNPGRASGDTGLTGYFRQRGVLTWFTVPALVDHRDEAHHAFYFRGAGSTALAIEWDCEAVSAIAHFRNTRNGSVIEVVAGSPEHQRLVANRYFKEIN